MALDMVVYSFNNGYLSCTWWLRLLTKCGYEEFARHSWAANISDEWDDMQGTHVSRLGAGYEYHKRAHAIECFLSEALNKYQEGYPQHSPSAAKKWGEWKM